MLKLLRDIAANGNNGGRGNRCGCGDRGGHGGRGNGNRVNCRTPDNISFIRCMMSLYYHTHGACNHASADYTRQAPGYEDLATMINCMGGSNAFCQPVTDLSVPSRVLQRYPLRVGGTSV